MTAATTTRPGSKLPGGVRMSRIWRRPDNVLVDGAVEVPVDANMCIVGALWLCQRPECPTVVWVHDPDPSARPEARYCTLHPLELVPAPVDPTAPDPVAAARAVSTSRIREVVAARRLRAAEATRARVEMLRAKAEAEARRVGRDLRGHLPSLGVSAAALLGGAVLAEQQPLLSAATGLAVGTFGAVSAYLVVYLVERHRARAAADGEFATRAAGRARRRARHGAGGAVALGAWLLLAAATGANPATWAGCGTLLVGIALIWVTNREHWDRLWETRRRLADLARLRAEKAAEQAAQEPEAPADATVDDNDPLAVGERMAARWRTLSDLTTVPAGFPMRRTWIVPETTRPVTAPIDGEVVRIGWEFAIHCEPGTLAARPGIPAPLLGARQWLADVLERDATTVELVDRPDGQPNRGLLILTDSAPLGGVVRWKGRDGVRRGADGSTYAHRGRSLQGEDVEEATYIPGQNTGGLVIGRRGGGKSADTIRRILNRLVTGVFPVLFDPKQFVDYGDFAGVIPMGCTLEHREVILTSLAEERKRRERWISRRPVKDRHGRTRPGESLWSLDDGPSIFHIWEEFHDLAREDDFVNRFTNHVRLERVAEMSAHVITQGGGLADLNNSILRSLLNQIELTTYRIDDHQARLGGARDLGYSPADLPRVPGMCLVMSDDAPPMPLRSAYIHRGMEDGSVFDQLYGPNMEPLLTAPTLPPETVEVWERTGLMDLWRLGQGHNGLERLQSATNTPDGPLPSSAAPAVGGSQKLPAADVILGIALSRRGSDCTRADVDGHEGWAAAGWSKAPAPSTVSRAATELEKDGHLTRDGGQWRVLPAGEGRAAQVLMLLLAMSGRQRALAEEQAAERAAEESAALA